MGAVNTVVYEATQLTYAAEPTGQPVGSVVTMHAVPMANSPIYQPVYNISPERFQLIMQGQPLTQEEISALTGEVAVPTSVADQAPATSVVAETFAEPASEPAEPSPDVPTDS